MQIKIPIIFLFFLASRNSQNPTCDQCAQVAEADKTICALDGILYSSVNCAQCANKDNYELFTCTAQMVNNFECANECKRVQQIYVCKEKCSTGDPNIIMCGSNGIPYSNYCQAQCSDPTVTPKFDCTVYGFSAINCFTKCKRALDCQISSAGSPPREVCGVDALTYPSVEELTCNNVRQVADDDGNPAFGIVDCKEYVALHYGKPVGLVITQTPSYSTYPRG